jgi:hypothetical protein
MPVGLKLISLSPTFGRLLRMLLRSVLSSNLREINSISFSAF